MVQFLTTIDVYVKLHFGELAVKVEERNTIVLFLLIRSRQLLNIHYLIEIAVLCWIANDVFVNEHILAVIFGSNDF